MTDRTPLERDARAVLCAAGQPGGYVRHLTEDEQTTLATIGKLPRAEWQTHLASFWAAHADRLATAKATIDEAEDLNLAPEE